jgi:hypothetical protein
VAREGLVVDGEVVDSSDDVGAYDHIADAEQFFRRLGGAIGVRFAP